MKHLFIPYELAIIAKEKGFNEPCIARYDAMAGEILFIISGLEKPMHNYDDDIQAFSNYCAPLYQQIVDWLRQMHNIEILVYSGKDKFGNLEFKGELIRFDGNRIKLTTPSKLYYYAFDTAIQEAFKLI